MKYESDILKRLINTYGLVGNPCYISEIIKEFIVRGKGRYPELFTYQSDWLAHIDEFGLNPSYTVSYTGQSIYAPNTLERPVKSAILKGSTKYRDIDTGEFLETFEEGRNLELVSVKKPVLTTSNEDGTKTNILTVNEEVDLRGIEDTKDTLDCSTGELIQRVKKIVLNDSLNWNPNDSNHKNTVDFYVAVEDKKSLKYETTIPKVSWRTDSAGIVIDTYHHKNLAIRVEKSRLSSSTVEGFKEYIKQNPITVLYELATESIKTVDLTIQDQNRQNIKQLMSFKGGTHFITGSLEGTPLPSVSVSVETDLKETLKVCSLEGNTL